MSVPNSIRLGPFTPTVLVKKRYIIFYLLIIWISTIPAVYEFWIYYHFLWDSVRPIHFLVYLPFLILALYFTMLFSSLLFAKLLLVIINKIHEPREGVFLRDKSDRQYRYWSIRNTIKRWPIWLAHKFPFPFLDNICFKMFGVKTTFSNSLFEGWVDTEFIEFGENVVVGQASQVKSSLIVGNLLIIKKIIIEENVRIGTHCIILPGTRIGRNSIITANTCTKTDQRLEGGWIYSGMPAKQVKRNYFFEKNIEDKIQF